jgi:hypothetical protein
MRSPLKRFHATTLTRGAGLNARWRHRPHGRTPCRPLDRAASSVRS